MSKQHEHKWIGLDISPVTHELYEWCDECSSVRTVSPIITAIDDALKGLSPQERMRRVRKAIQRNLQVENLSLRPSHE